MVTSESDRPSRTKADSPSRATPVLRCRLCGNPANADVRVQYCPDCFGPLEFDHSWERLIGATTVESIDAGTGIGRWAPLLGLSLEADREVGDVPLRRAGRLAEHLGLDNLWLLDETTNPTRSFKDRLVAAALPEARGRSASVLACASTGNLALALAGASISSGILAVVLVPDDLGMRFMSKLACAGAVVIPVAAGFDSVNRLAAEAAGMFENWAWANVDLRPWYVEGARTSGWEIARGLGWRLPDAVIAPIASGSYLRLVHDSLRSLVSVGLVDDASVRLLAAQPSGCAPVAGAFMSGAASVAPVRSTTSVSSVAMGDPPEGDDLLATSRETGGTMVVVEEGDVEPARRLLAATEGIDADLAVGVVVAGLRQMVATGQVEPEECVVICVTGGHGVSDGILADPKDPRDSSGRMLAHQASGPGRKTTETPLVTASIEPTVEALRAVVDSGVLKS